MLRLVSSRLYAERVLFGTMCCYTSYAVYSFGLSLVLRVDSGLFPLSLMYSLVLRLCTHNGYTPDISDLFVVFFHSHLSY